MPQSDHQSWLQMPEIKFDSLKNSIWMESCQVDPFWFGFFGSSLYSWDSPILLTTVSLVPSIALLSRVRCISTRFIQSSFLFMDLWAVSRFRLLSLPQSFMYASSDEYIYTLTLHMNAMKLVSSRPCWLCWTVADTNLKCCQVAEPIFTTNSSV